MRITRCGYFLFVMTFGCAEKLHHGVDAPEMGLTLEQGGERQEAVAPAPKMVLVKGGTLPSSATSLPSPTPF